MLEYPVKRGIGIPVMQTIFGEPARGIALTLVPVSVTMLRPTGTWRFFSVIFLRRS